MLVVGVLLVVALLIDRSEAFGPVFRRQMWGNVMSVKKLEAEVGAEESKAGDEMEGKGMPNKSDFAMYFMKTVSGSTKEMCLDEFMRYEPVEDMLSSGLITSRRPVMISR